MSKILEIKNIEKTFNAGTVNENYVLKNLSLDLEDGDYVTVIGGNGAGKSTMLKAKVKDAEQFLVFLFFVFRQAPLETTAFAAAVGKCHIFADGHICCCAHARVLEHTAKIFCTLILFKFCNILAVDDDMAAVHGN